MTKPLDFSHAVPPLPPSPLRADVKGIVCPRCGCGHFRVVYTRAKLGGRIMRRRECRHCGRRITTWEK